MNAHAADANCVVGAGYGAGAYCGGSGGGSHQEISSFHKTVLLWGLHNSTMCKTAELTMKPVPEQKGRSMRKACTATFVTVLILAGIAALTATYSRSQTPPGNKQGRGAPPATGWQAKPEWVESRYGGWRAPGVPA